MVMSLEYLKTYSSKSTVTVYKWALSKFLSHVGIKEGSLEERAKAYFASNRNYQEDVTSFFTSIKDLPPKSREAALAGVRVFLMENGVELPALFWRKLRGRGKGSRALMLDKVPSNTELKAILMHMDAKGKSLFLTLASSGMRIGEALKLKIDDLDLSSDPARITIRGEHTKTGNPRVAFISSEAKEAIQEWLKIREGELETAVKRSARFPKEGKDDRVWPFEDNTAYLIWRNAVEKSGFAKKFQYNNGTERLTVHPHVLRKFFRTRMATVIPVDVTEALMGHEGYLTEVYRRYSLEDLAEFYKKGEHVLLVFGNGKDLAVLRAEVEEKNKQLQQIINGLVSENLELKERIKKLEDGFKKIQELKKALEEAIGKKS
jgi:integrase